jgi:hypothetical protein
MTQTTASNTHSIPAYNPITTPDGGSSSYRAAILTAAVILVLLTVSILGVIYSSPAREKHAAVRASLSPKLAAAPAVPQLAPLTTTAKTRKPAAKRASSATYVNDAYGISFTYPRKYTLEAGQTQLANSDTGLAPMNFVEPGGVTIAEVQLPEQVYPGTDFASAAFGVSVNPSLDALRCSQFPPPTDSGEVVREPLVGLSALKGGETRMAEDFVSAGNTQAKYYHLFAGETCYEFQLAVRTRVEEDSGDRVAVNRNEVFSKLQKILASVTILGRRGLVGE